MGPTDRIGAATRVRRGTDGSPAFAVLTHPPVWPTLLRITNHVVPSANEEAVLRVCSLADLPPGEALRVDEVFPPIAVFRTDDGEVYAIDDTCTHQDASLADGWLEGCEVECPLHASRFDLRTGQVDEPPAKRGVRTHLVTITDGDIYVTPSSAAPNLPPGVSSG